MPIISGPYLPLYYGRNLDLEEYYQELRNFRTNMEALSKKKVQMIPTKITKKFYVGSLSVFNSGNTHLKANINEAVNEAKQKCEETGDEQFVVQIIRVIRPERIPIKVEKV